MRLVAVMCLALVLVLVGLVLMGGGGYLIAFGGSPYYLIAGIFLIVSGGLLALRRSEGAAVYALVFFGTIVWAFWEVGLNDWGLMPRLIGPLVLFLFVLLTTPLLRPHRLSWPGSLAAILVTVILAALTGIGVAIYERSTYVATEALPSAEAAMPDPSRLKAGVDWPAYGGTYAGRRYSPLSQINVDTVGRLKRAWVFHTGDLPEGRPGAVYASENTPLKIGDTLYVCSAKNIVEAVNAATGALIWKYDPQVLDAYIPYSAVCRGVAYYSVPDARPDEVCAARIIEGTLDARVIALDAKTGQPCPGFGVAGQVDTSIGIGEHDPGMYSITSSPVVVRGTIVVGHQVLDGQELNAPSGVILAYDAVTGAQKWAWDMRRPERTGPPPDGDTYSRGTPNMWTEPAGDEQLGLVYLPLGVTAGDYWAVGRAPADLEYGTSLVAVNVDTGLEAWHFQTVHTDLWDYDLGSQPSLVDFPGADGTKTPALILPTKRGDIFVLDRRTGQPLSPVEERRVPVIGLEASVLSETQPFSTFHTLTKRDLTEADMWGMSPIDQMLCRIQFRKSVYKGMFTPPTDPTKERYWIEYPGYNGGNDWGSFAIDSSRGVIVANYNDIPNRNNLMTREEANRLGWHKRARKNGKVPAAEGASAPQEGAPYAVNVSPGWLAAFTGLLCKAPPYGGIRAIDLASGKTIWDRPFGSAWLNGPFDIPSGMPFTIGTPNNGGPVVTAGGLIFIAATTDDMIRAIDLKTGQTLWSDVLPGGGQATPMTYSINGKQYLVITAGGHRIMRTKVTDEVVAYALPDN
jgi:quinoprotein glucose dehydrogenase